jgi:hypothetical protein
VRNTHADAALPVDKCGQRVVACPFCLVQKHLLRSDVHIGCVCLCGRDGEHSNDAGAAALPYHSTRQPSRDVVSSISKRHSVCAVLAVCTMLLPNWPDCM